MDTKPLEKLSTESKILTLADIQAQVEEIKKAVAANDPRPVYRVVRKLFTTIRKHLSSSDLKLAVVNNLVNGSDLEKDLVACIDLLPASNTAQESDMIDVPSEATRSPQAESSTPLAEVDVYLNLLVLVALIDNGQNEVAMQCSSSLIARLMNLNRRTLNPLAAKSFFYYSLSYELSGRLDDVRQTLLAAHRISSLRHDDETHMTILNLLLRNYLHYNLVEQADKLQAKTTLEDSASSNQLARFRYYQGRIKAIQLDYTGAYSDLQEALRKAPQHSARGFRLTVQKHVCIVQLLMGEIPERSIFRQKGLRAALKPYLQLTQAVRVGDLDAFHTVVKNFGDVFRGDKTITLIQRLRHNVIKTGLRKINISYSRIHLADICAKLRLDNVEDVEFIVAKAIRDGVIDASIDHEGSFIHSKEHTDAYSTQEPLEAYHARINFCLKVHNEAVKAMRYPPEAPKSSVFSAEKKEISDASPEDLLGDDDIGED